MKYPSHVPSPPLRRYVRRALATAAAALLGGLGHAAAASAQVSAAPVGIGITSGRAESLVAVVVGLISIVIGKRALARAAARSGNGGRRGAIVGLVLALVGMLLSGLHLARTTGGFGTGGGKAGAIVGLVVGLIGMVIAGRAMARARGTA
jgi:hypothetical protein